MTSSAGGKVASSSKTGFVAADLVPLPGLKQPFNFMGRLAAEGRRELEALLDRAAEEDDKVKVEDRVGFVYSFIKSSRVLGFRAHHPLQGPLTHLCDLEAG